MDKKLPSISKFSDDKEFTNNKQTYYSYVKTEDDRNSFNEVVNQNKNIDTLDDLFNNGLFVFNVPVNIKTTTNSISTTIVGKVDDHIITSDNHVIRLVDIISIKVN